MNMEESFIETGHYYVQVLDYLREMAHSITFVTKPSFDHVDNNHKPMLDIQSKELETLSVEVRKFISAVSQAIKANDYGKVQALISEQQDILKMLDTIRKNQVKRIKSNEVGTRNSMLYLNILAETKNMLLQLINLLKSQRDFSEFITAQDLKGMNN
jgi:Na+/phosphate symporter